MILEKLENTQLSFLTKIKHDKEFATFKEIINILIDVEKNSFFGDDESKYDNHVWQARHAYARGGIAKLILFMNIMVGSEMEFNRRESERKKKKDGHI